MSPDNGSVPRPRTLVLCFDGTADQFDEDNSNVVKFFSLLKKDDETTQMCYYQAGIGTYYEPGAVSPLLRWVASKVDMAVAWYLSEHVCDGYRFLMQNYRKGDRICLFGFSRGAYVARALAGMLQKMGLLLKDNDEQVPFAYKLYTRTDAAGVRLAGQFKLAFAREVQIAFVGVWDTVSSVGVVTARTLPFTDANRGIRTFRHALALDERRARFRPNLWHRPAPPPEPTPTPVSRTERWRQRARVSLGLPRLAPHNPDHEDHAVDIVEKGVDGEVEAEAGMETRPSGGSIAGGLLFGEPLPVQSTISGASGPTTASAPASLPLSQEHTLKGERPTAAARLRSILKRARNTVSRSGATSPSSLPGTPAASSPVSPGDTLKDDKKSPPTPLKSLVQRAQDTMKRVGGSPSSLPSSLPPSPAISPENTLKGGDAPVDAERPDTLRAESTSTRLARLQSLVRRHPADLRLPHYRRGSHSDSDLAEVARALRRAGAGGAPPIRAPDADTRAETDVLEVWFPGSHADVGGGNVSNDTRRSLAQVTLRWMVREATSAQCGIVFDARALRRLVVQPSLLGSPRVAGRRERALDRKDMLAPIVDRLNFREGLPWYALEWIPTIERWQDRDGRWKRRWSFNRGRGRKITEQPGELNFHFTVRERMENPDLHYVPRARWERGTETYVE